MRKPLSVRTAVFVFAKYYIDKESNGILCSELDEISSVFTKFRVKTALISQNSEENGGKFHIFPKRKCSKNRWEHKNNYNSSVLNVVYPS